MERRSYIGRVNPEYVKTFSSKIIKIDEKDIKGYAALVEIEEVHRPFMVGNLCLRDNGYKEIRFLPEDKNWMLWAMYDAKGDIIEWYFDITRKNALDENGEPYCDDLYLDVALMPDGQIHVFDEDELKEALDSGNITQEDFSMAYNVLNELKEKFLNLTHMETLCARLWRLFS